MRGRRAGEPTVDEEIRVLRRETTTMSAGRGSGMGPGENGEMERAAENVCTVG